jgi:hypothetical protein
VSLPDAPADSPVRPDRDPSLLGLDGAVAHVAGAWQGTSPAGGAGTGRHDHGSTFDWAGFERGERAALCITASGKDPDLRLQVCCQSL